MKYRIAVNACEYHPNVQMLSLDDESGGQRLLGPKCCGRWSMVREWPLDDADARSIAIELECVAERLESPS